MTNISVVTKRFYPPWSDGIVSYARGFVESVLEAAKKKDLHLSILSLTDAEWFPSIRRNELSEYLSTRPIDFRWFSSPRTGSIVDVLRALRVFTKDIDCRLTHIVFAGLEPILTRLVSLEMNHAIIKHLFIYPTQVTLPLQKHGYCIMERSRILDSLNIGFSVSDRNLQSVYGLKRAFVVPPAINTELFRPFNGKHPNSHEAFETLNRAKARIGDLRKVLARDVMALYMGPLIPGRFNFRSISDALLALKNDFSIDIGLVAVGRGFEDPRFLSEINHIIEKNRLEDRVFICMKTLTEKEKVCLLNQSSIFLYLFQNLASMSVVFPPIALLESMSTGNVVVTGGLPHLNSLIKTFENGILIGNVDDGIAIARGISNALVHMRKIARNAKARIEAEFSTVKVSKVYSELLESYGI